MWRSHVWIAFFIFTKPGLSVGSIYVEVGLVDYVAQPMDLDGAWTAHVVGEKWRLFEFEMIGFGAVPIPDQTVGECSEFGFAADEVAVQLSGSGVVGLDGANGFGFDYDDRLAVV